MTWAGVNMDKLIGELNNAVGFFLMRTNFMGQTGFPPAYKCVRVCPVNSNPSPAEPNGTLCQLI